MATVKEKADEWDCSPSTVRDYCASGLIPPAEKKGMPPKWEIPDDWPRPPMGRHGLCFLLDTIYQLNCGVEYDSIRWGYKAKEVRDGYRYLISSAFMSTIDTSNLSVELKRSHITPRGAQLIKKENEKGRSKTKFTAYAKLRGSIGIASLEAGGEVSN